MNQNEITALLTSLNRIATALERQHHDDPATTARLLDIQERAVASMEEHNRHHREQGLTPAEPPQGVIQ